ncbi:shikimate dehydrogenase [Desulfonema ishimotonii]|uniref:Shikimate dehydrogenase (NADP(+)) n=1 Tax=Desulfonema ishimotonii TaxID=45657 RepID=A0A401FWV0_9BACT|nr:shikimate dehydrogenase [Desulfonema ishimotonii]GBC61431.1 shikimate dehydrogenase [Desulfonema ishimotonii]
MNINTRTSLYGVFGNPVSHSLSPAMHNAAFRQVGHDGVYLAFEIREIEAGITAVRALNIRGVSVTIPHKISIMPLLDHLDPMARKIGAVNTVVNQDGVLTGYNSDGLGAVAALKEKTEIAGQSVAVIGAGGAARAIAFGVQAEGGNVTIVNRSADKGERLAKDLNADFRPLSEFSGEDVRILINTTPLGMTPNVDATPVPADKLEPGMVVMDIVYNPLETRLLREAGARGCTTVDGVAMFVYQGAFQSELWTGQKAPVDVMKQMVLDALKK